ncbi:hypothetical protein [Roseibium sp.]|uniref:hypothetical protein n=1 Tax=Roseibium sp. TaxID=1936156 RepID=UPI0032635A67
MLKVRVIIGAYLILFLIVAGLIVAGEFFGPNFRRNYGGGLLQLLGGIVAAFLGFLSAFAAEK